MLRVLEVVVLVRESSFLIERPKVAGFHASRDSATNSALLEFSAHFIVMAEN